MKYNKIVQHSKYVPEVLAGEVPNLVQNTSSEPENAKHVQTKKHHQAK